MKKKLSEEEIIRIFKNYQAESKKAREARDFLYEYFLPLFDEYPFKKRLKDEDLRMDAYVDAIEQFIRILKEETEAKYEYRKEGMIPYFCTIFEKKCIDVFRKENRKSKLNITSMEHSFLQNLDDRNYLGTTQQISTYLDSISFWTSMYQFKEQNEHCFHILLLRYVQGFSIKKVAEILGKTVNTVKVQSSACLKKFQLFNNNRKT